MIILICNDHLDLQVYSSATLLELDDIYTRRLAGFTNLPGFNIDNHGCHHCYIVVNINIIIFNCLVAGFTNLPGLRLSWLLSSLPALLSSLLISKLSCLSMLILWLPCCHNFQYQIHDWYNPTWKYFRLLQCHELQTPSAEHQGTFNVHQEMPQDSRSPEVLPNCLVQ